MPTHLRHTSIRPPGRALAQNRKQQQSEPTSASFLGETIRDIRKARGLTLEAIAFQSKISIGYLSLIERNKVTPSIKTLHDLASVLGVNISWFFSKTHVEDAEEQKYIVRARDRKSLSFGSGIVDELLSPNLRGQLELLSSRFEPGASSGNRPYTHRGEEAGVVISGQLDIWIGKKKFRLKTGDSFSFLSTIPHRYLNPGKVDAIVIWAITPPTY